MPRDSSAGSTGLWCRYEFFPNTPVQQVVRQLPYHPQAASIARGEVRTALHRWGVSEEVADAVLLVVSELVTNGVEHAKPPLVLRARQDVAGYRIHVEVTDGGAVASAEAGADSPEPDEHGRGLVIVKSCSTAHGSWAHSGGTTYWAGFGQASLPARGHGPVSHGLAAAEHEGRDLSSVLGWNDH
ncbi:ATP-binding protein [Streptomyces sp. NPDC001177]